MHNQLILGIFLAATAPAWAANRALLIGISKYEHPEQIKTLPGIDLDLDNMREVAGRMGYKPAQIKTLRDKSRTDSESFHEQLSGIGEQMHAIVEASTFDEAAARALLAKEAQIETELKLIRIRTDNAIHNLLTAEQKAKLDELRRNPGRNPGRPQYGD